MDLTGKSCENCNGNTFVRTKEGKQLVCKECGTVIVDVKVDEGPEWRSFEGEEEDRVRVGMQPTLLMPDKGLSTKMGPERKDASGNVISGEAWRDIGRQKKWQSRISTGTSKERNLSQALNVLNRIGKALDIPQNVLERAAYVYRMALQRDLIRGRAIKSIMAAALYASIRYNEIPRTLSEVSEAADIEEPELNRDYTLLVRELKLRMPVVDPAKYIKKICAKVGLSKKVLVEAEKIVRLAQKKGITSGKGPEGVAAAAVYYSCELLGVEKSQREIAFACEVTTVTVRNRFKDLERNLRLDGPVTIDMLRS